MGQSARLISACGIHCVLGPWKVLEFLFTDVETEAQRSYMVYPVQLSTG